MVKRHKIVTLLFSVAKVSFARDSAATILVNLFRKHLHAEFKLHQEIYVVDEGYEMNFFKTFKSGFQIKVLAVWIIIKDLKIWMNLKDLKKFARTFKNSSKFVFFGTVHKWCHIVLSNEYWGHSHIDHRTFFMNLNIKFLIRFLCRLLKCTRQNSCDVICE